LFAGSFLVFFGVAREGSSKATEETLSFQVRPCVSHAGAKLIASDSGVCLGCTLGAWGIETVAENIEPKGRRKAPTLEGRMRAMEMGFGMRRAGFARGTRLRAKLRATHTTGDAPEGEERGEEEEEEAMRESAISFPSWEVMNGR
jgi:hypothetical protein